MDGLDRALPRYLSILRGEAEPRFRTAKRFNVDFDPAMGFEDLMAIHGQALRDMTSGRPGEGGDNLLGLKATIARRMLDSCILCERRCGAARSRGQKGHCGVLGPRISSEFLHFGEEPELVPSYTIFFSGCTFECVFCQNYDISQYPSGGETYSPEVVAGLIDRKTAARNVNWVGGDPTSNLGFILDVLLRSETYLPQVWNSNMYLTEEAMALLDGVVDLYLTDFKYGNDDCARRLSKVEDYWGVITRNHMLARERAELIVRHLVLPNHVECCSKPVLDWLAEHLGDEARVNVMAQYRPMYQAREYPEISQPLKYHEFLEARGHAEDLGLNLVE